MAETDYRPGFLTADYLKSHGPHPEVPQWDRLELLTMKSDVFDFVVPEGKKGGYRLDLTEDGGAFCLYINTVEAVNPEFGFTLRAKSPILLKGVGTSCGCIAQNVAFTEGKNIYADVKVNLVEWAPGDYQRDMRFHYELESAPGKEENVPVVFKIHISANPDAGARDSIRQAYRAEMEKARREHEERERRKREGGGDAEGEAGSAGA